MRFRTGLVTAALLLPGPLFAQHGHGGFGGGHGGFGGGHIGGSFGHGGFGRGHIGGGLGHGGFGLGGIVRTSGVSLSVGVGRGISHRGLLSPAISFGHVDVFHPRGLLARHGLRVGVAVGAPFYYSYPYYSYPCYSYPYFGSPYFGSPYFGYLSPGSLYAGPTVVTTRTVVVERPARRAAAPAEEPSPGRIADSLIVEPVGDDILRLTWRQDGQPVGEVGLFVADAEQKVLTVQTLRAAPFRALFDVTPRIAYVGVTVVYQDGVQTTTLVPYKPRRKE